MLLIVADELLDPCGGFDAALPLRLVQQHWSHWQDALAAKEPGYDNKPPGRSCATWLGRKGQAFLIINTHGQQVVDTWCFNADDLSEFMSMEHLHASLQGIFPAKGDGLATNRRRPILMLEEDTSLGRHGTIIAACDVHRYAALGCRDYHDNCTDSLHAALVQVDLRVRDSPAPLNLWMNIPWAPTAKSNGESRSARRGLCDPARRDGLRRGLSTSLQDMIPITGAACQPTEVHYRLLD